MNPQERLLDELLDMQEAAAEALGFVDGFTFERFEAHVLTQRAVAMTFVMLSTSASRILTRFPDFVADQPDIAWLKIKGFRNVIVHEYDTIDWKLVWNTVHDDLPVLIAQIDQLRHPHAQGE